MYTYVWIYIYKYMCIYIQVEYKYTSVWIDLHSGIYFLTDSCFILYLKSGSGFDSNLLANARFSSVRLLGSVELRGKTESLFFLCHLILCCQNGKHFEGYQNSSSRKGCANIPKYSYIQYQRLQETAAATKISIFVSPRNNNNNNKYKKCWCYNILSKGFCVPILFFLCSITRSIFPRELSLKKLNPNIFSPFISVPNVLISMKDILLSPFLPMVGSFGSVGKWVCVSIEFECGVKRAQFLAFGKVGQ